ncbi:hypothetical protein [Arthrobacter sp. JZ12]|nr:hypothetical protein [Arthrobacter sp. JZ12]
MYREAIAAFDGVETVSVEWHRNGVGDSTTPSDLGVVLRTLGEIRRY